VVPTGKAFIRPDIWGKREGSCVPETSLHSILLPEERHVGGLQMLTVIPVSFLKPTEKVAVPNRGDALPCSRKKHILPS
jgi:hypothetical protein